MPGLPLEPAPPPSAGPPATCGYVDGPRPAARPHPHRPYNSGQIMCYESGQVHVLPTVIPVVTLVLGHYFGSSDR
jgi:hypothetical protein